jgi:hypothetical protein
MKYAALVLATLALVLTASGVASARTAGTCTFKSNTMSIGVALSGSDVGAGFCSILRQSLGWANVARPLCQLPPDRLLSVPLPPP